MIAFLLLACGAATPDGPPVEPVARVKWLMMHEYDPQYREEMLDILRTDPDRNHRLAAWFRLQGAAPGPYPSTTTNREAITAMFESWVTFRAKAGDCWDASAMLQHSCVLLWGCKDDGDARHCHADAPPECHSYDVVRQGCFRDQGPCIQMFNSIPDQGPGSPRMLNNVPWTSDARTDPAIVLAGQEAENPPLLLP